MRFYGWILLWLFFSTLCFSQEDKKVEIDTVTTQELNEVIVTGQYNPQSVKKSVYEVKVINRQAIEQQAGNTLADLLNFNLNLTIIPNSQSGRSTVSFFGLDSQYFNILIDNIPLVSDNGLGNNIDLTQINLDDVERIEIVEGAMGVEYGANSVSGVINIITKKSAEGNWNLNAILQEETVGNEYAWFDEGRHIQGFNLSHNINEKWFARATFNRNDFAGFFGSKQGQDYYANDGLRGYEWLPKRQITTGAFVHYKTDNFKLSYKFEYFNELINFYDATVRPNIDVDSQTSNPSATDKIYTTNRFVNNLYANGKLNSGANYNASLSYQQQDRDLNEFNYYILTKEKTNETDETYQSSKVLFSKGAINNLVTSDFYNFEAGYELRYIEGFDTQATGEFTQGDKSKSYTNYAAFGSTELYLTDRLNVRPGLRYEYNTQFKSYLTGSINARYLFKDYELRGSFGTSYRVPNFEELYYYFVDSNHDVRGNESLNPEKGISASVSLKKRSLINNTSLVNSLKLFYIDLSDKIDLAVVNTLPLQYQYINIDNYSLWSLTSTNTLSTENWNFNFGATLQGISQSLDNESNIDDKFLCSFQLNSSISYNIPKWNTVVAAMLKYNGKQKNYIGNATDDDGNTVFTQQTTDGYGWLDASIKKDFFKDSFQVTMGGRNLLDITSVDINGTQPGGTHSGTTGSLLLGYGRSFYIKLLYNLNL